MKSARTPLLAALLLAATLVAAGCGAGEGTHEAKAIEPVDGIEDRLVRVVTTTNFVSDMVEQVGGDRVDVEPLMGPGVDPHLYKASAGDVSDISEADLVVYVGLHLEAKMVDVFERSSAQRATVAVGDALDEKELIEATPGMGGEYDPHIWFDPDLWSQTPDVVADALAALDPEHADEYHERADEHAAEMREAGEAADEQLADVDERSRVIVTSHDAFRYLGRRFDFDVEAIQGISTASEATTDDIERIAGVLAERRVRSVFVESSVPRRTIDSVLAAAADRGWNATVGGELFSDAAGDAGTHEGTYLGMLEHNIDAIEAGLR